ncbi:MAG: hypothetical protein C0596_09950 [Marinilabiliales bacterium]|nr:MAG: hypothetical protein C0596_09950 [Marinilabiliales bacterium]
MGKEKYYLFLSLIIVCIIQTSCKVNEQTEYSFFIAGHSYGKPFVDNEGFHPPFKQKFLSVQDSADLEFGFLLGDIVWIPSEKDWDEIDKDIEDLGLPVYIACGNHEMKDSALFVERYGPTYFYFIKNKDLFIVLDPNIDNWNISVEQLSFLKKVIKKKSKRVDNIFVMTHQLIWWDKDRYPDIKLNSLEGKDENLNFWDEVEPIFHTLDNNVVFCAGDLGANTKASDFMFDKYDNITLVATGMGEGEGDNFVIIKVDNDKNVYIELINLNTDQVIHLLN